MIRKLLEDQQALARASVGAGLFALTCGIGSVALSILKQRGMLTAPEIATWRPLLLVWAVVGVATSMAFALQLRRFPATTRAHIRRKVLLVPTLLALSSMLLLVASLTLEDISAKLSALSERQWPAKLSSNAISRSFHLEMDCSGCARAIEATIRKETLAQKAKADYQKGEITIWINPDETSFRAVIQSLNSRGFTPAEIDLTGNSKPAAGD